jgi:very-short-patch-repair endonuclease
MTRYYGLNQEQIDFIKQNYPYEGSLFCAIKVGLTKDRIIKVAHMLGIKTSQKVMNRNLSLIQRKRLENPLEREKISKGNRKNIIYKCQDQVIDMYVNKKINITKISKLYNLKSNTSVSNILKENNIIVTANVDKATYWTKEMDNYLEENYYRGEKSIIIQHLKLSWNSIKHRASRLQIQRDLDFFRSRETRKFNLHSNPMHNQYSRLKASQSLKRYIQENPILYRKRMIKRNKKSKLEQAIEFILKKHNINYYWNAYVKTKESYKFPDFLIGNKLIIEADGEHWHSKLKEIPRDRELINMGYHILHFHEYTIQKNKEKVERCILSKLKELNLLV